MNKTFTLDGSKWTIYTLPTKEIGGKILETLGMGKADDNMTVYGICHHPTKEIFVASRNSPRDAQNTLLHEVIHACLSCFEGIEENTVVVLADRLQHVLDQIGWEKTETHVKKQTKRASKTVKPEAEEKPRRRTS